MAGVDAPRVLLIWPFGVQGAESIPMAMSFLVPQLMGVANVTVLDCSLNGFHPNSQQFADIVRTIQPDMVGISAWSQNWRYVQRTIGRLREIAPDAAIVVGGPHVTATGDTGGANFALLGECEHTLPQLVTALANNEDVTGIPGLRQPNQIHTSAPALVQDLDALGLPNFDAMLLKEYQAGSYRYRSGKALQAPILATRGCPYVCAFCEAPMMSGRVIRKHSIGYLKDLLLHLREQYGVSHVNIVDDNFTFYKDYAKQFCEMVLQNRAALGDMTFATPNGLRVERSDAELFKMMKAAGWERVIFAPESGSQRMVDIMAKHLDLGILPAKVAEAQEAGLKVEAFFILNYPGETAEDVEETRQFIQRVPFDAISLHIFKPLPHTPIWRELVDSGSLPPDYVIGRYDEIDWLANGRTVEDVRAIIGQYQSAAKSIFRVA